ncbi:MAG: hypothetical protein AAGU19_16635 [Prolixibacteraceae bacterium]
MPFRPEESMKALNSFTVLQATAYGELWLQ